MLLKYQQVLSAAIDSLVRKAKLIAEFHLPAIQEKYRAQHHQHQQQQQVQAVQKSGPSITVASSTDGGGQNQGQQKETETNTSKVYFCIQKKKNFIVSKILL